MARALKGLAVLIPALRTTAQTADCVKFGMEYDGHQVVTPPGYVASWQDCQFQCAITVFCEHFTYKAVSVPSKNLLANSCRKFGSYATLVPADLSPGDTNPNDTVSGSVRCLSETTVAPNRTAVVVTIAPALPTGIPTMAPVSTDANTTKVTMVPGGEMGGETSGGSGLPWWAMLLIALIVVGIAAAAILVLCGGKKKKATAKKAKKARKEPLDSETQALVHAEAPPPMAEPSQAAAPMATGLPLPAAPGAPLPQMSGIQMASPVATGGIPIAQPMQMASPVATGGIPMAQPAFGSGSQVVYVQQAAPIQTVQMQSMPMMQQPQFR